MHVIDEDGQQITLSKLNLYHSFLLWSLCDVGFLASFTIEPYFFEEMGALGPVIASSLVRAMSIFYATTLFQLLQSWNDAMWIGTFLCKMAFLCTSQIQ